MANKLNIAVVAGGYSGEYEISINSAGVIRKNLDSERFQPYTVIITRQSWICRLDDGTEAKIDLSDFSFIQKNQKVTFDCALITIHGSPGEDGKLQGYFDMIGLPYTTSGQLACSITFNKYFCNTLAAYWGINVARSAKFARLQALTESKILEKVSLPVFVKPNKGGSSLGTFFVKDAGELITSISACLQHDDEALVEEYISGTEVTCGVFRQKGEIRVLPVTEIVSKTESRFFDYKAKYTMGAAEEITPARIDESTTYLVQQTTAFLYEKFELKGVCRLDYIFTGDKLFFLEANITPGMSERSIVPQQAAHIGISLKELYSVLIDEALGM